MDIKFLLRKSNRTSTHLIRSVLSSNVGFAMDFCLLAALVESARMPYLIAATISFSVGTSFVYLLNIAWVFPHRRFSDRRLEYLIFFGMGAAGLVLNAVLMLAFTEGLGIYYLVSKVGSGIIVFFMNFLSRKFVLFTNAGAKTP